MYENLLNQNFLLGLCAFLQGDATLVFFMCINFSVSGFFVHITKNFILGNLFYNLLHVYVSDVYCTFHMIIFILLTK